MKSIQSFAKWLAQYNKSIAAAVPLVLAKGEDIVADGVFDNDERKYVAGALISVVLVFLVPNKKKPQAPPSL